MTAGGSGMTSGKPLLEVGGIVRNFPGVRALKGVRLSVDRGEILGLVGENGAGKSTLIRILGGALQPDEGVIRLDGNPVHFAGPVDSMRAGIAIIHQELNLVPQLDITDNLFLGKELMSGFLLNRRAQQSRAEWWLDRLGLAVSPATPAGRLSVSQQQMIEIARALEQNARVLIMDEPTAALTGSEAARLHEIARELRNSGIAIIYVSHRLDEIFSLTDTVTVLRDGEFIDSRPTRDFSRREVIESMVGRDLTSEFPPGTGTFGEVVLEVRNLSKPPVVRDFSMTLRRGEIVGVTGMVGSGRTEAARVLFGADAGTIGSMKMNGRDVRFRSPREAIAGGLALLPEDRKRHGLVPGHSCGENFLLPNLDAFSNRAGLVREGKARSVFEEWVETLKIRCRGWWQPARTLSGGNQQKVVLAKWLVRDAEVLIFDEPTRGIDVGARFEFYQWMRKLAAEGRGIIMISSDMEEVLGMSDRIITMADGCITAELVNDPSLTARQVLHHTIDASSRERDELNT